MIYMEKDEDIIFIDAIRKKISSVITIEDKNEFMKVAKVNNIKTIFRTETGLYFPLNGVLVRYLGTK